MGIVTTWILGAALAVMPMFGMHPLKRIDVDCDAGQSLDHALRQAARFQQTDIVLHGICRGHFVIDAYATGLRGATPDSGLAAPAGDDNLRPVLEIVDANVSLRGMTVRGTGLDIVVRGWDASVLLYEVDVAGGVGVVAQLGATARVLDSTLHDGDTGVGATSGSTINLQRVTVREQGVGILASDNSRAVLTDTTIENNREGGLIVSQRSEAIVWGGVFRDNGQVHISATDWSSVSLQLEVILGSDGDATPFALGATRNARIASYSTPHVFGRVSALDRASIRLGNTVLHGELTAMLFADAHVRGSQITRGVFCAEGGDVICSSMTTDIVYGCPSSTCGPTSRALDGAPVIPTFPEIELPHLDRPSDPPQRQPHR